MARKSGPEKRKRAKLLKQQGKTVPKGSGGPGGSGRSASSGGGGKG